MAKQNKQLLQKLPSVDVLLKDSELQSYIADVGRKVVVDSIRQAIDEIRKILIGETAPPIDEVAIR